MVCLNHLDVFELTWCHQIGCTHQYHKFPMTWSFSESNIHEKFPEVIQALDSISDSTPVVGHFKGDWISNLNVKSMCYCRNLSSFDGWEGSCHSICGWSNSHHCCFWWRDFWYVSGPNQSFYSTCFRFRCWRSSRCYCGWCTFGSYVWLRRERISWNVCLLLLLLGCI